MREDIAEQFLDRFKELGLKLEHNNPPIGHYESFGFYPVRVWRGRSSEYFMATYLPSLTLTELLSSIPPEIREDHRILALGRRINTRTAHVFRQERINFLDLAGNAYVEFGDVLVDIRGAPRQSSSSRGEALRTGEPNDSHPANLFTKRRSQVLFALLAWPELLDEPVRKISRAARASLGIVQETLKLLESSGFLSSGTTRRFLRQHELIDLWTASYPVGLGSPTLQREFRGDPQHLKEVPGSLLSVSGEAAVPNMLNHQSLILYTDEFDIELAIQNRWRKDSHPNIFVRPKFWRSPQHIDSSDHGGVCRAPELLIYADLLASGEPRQREAAIRLREENALLSKS